MTGKILRNGDEEKDIGDVLGNIHDVFGKLLLHTGTQNSQGGEADRASDRERNDCPPDKHCVYKGGNLYRVYDVATILHSKPFQPSDPVGDVVLRKPLAPAVQESNNEHSFTIRPDSVSNVVLNAPPVSVEKILAMPLDSGGGLDNAHTAADTGATGHDIPALSPKEIPTPLSAHDKRFALHSFQTRGVNDRLSAEDFRKSGVNLALKSDPDVPLFLCWGDECSPIHQPSPLTGIPATTNAHIEECDRKHIDTGVDRYLHRIKVLQRQVAELKEHCRGHQVNDHDKIATKIEQGTQIQ